MKGPSIQDRPSRTKTVSLVSVSRRVEPGDRGLSFGWSRPRVRVRTGGVECRQTGEVEGLDWTLSFASVKLHVQATDVRSGLGSWSGMFGTEDSTPHSSKTGAGGSRHRPSIGLLQHVLCVPVLGPRSTPEVGFKKPFPIVGSPIVSPSRSSDDLRTGRGPAEGGSGSTWGWGWFFDVLCSGFSPPKIMFLPPRIGPFLNLFLLFSQSLVVDPHVPGTPHPTTSVLRLGETKRW